MGNASAQSQGSATGPALSGGAATGTQPGNNPTTTPYFTSPQFSKYGANVNGTSLSCAGGITAQWTWNTGSAGSAVPQQYLVEQVSSATWESKTATGKCDDGLGDSPTSTTNSSGDTTSTSGGTHYSVKPAAASGNLEVDCTPSASVSSGSCGVYYTPSAYPVTVSLGGTTLANGTQYGLTGQQITASLVTPNGLPSGTKITSYTWSGQSGTCFKTYNPNISPPANNQLTPLASTDLSGTDTSGNGINVSPLAFYDSAGENLTLSCAVTLTAPDGTTLNVTAASPQIMVEKPTLTASSIAEGYVQLSSDGSAFGLYGNLNGTGNSTNGMIWSNFTVNVPAPFSGNGQCTFTQLVNPDHLEYVNGSSTPIGSNNGILGLDGSFEYGTAWNVTGTGNDVDSPNQPLFYRTGLTKISVSDAFTTYVMYQPSGGVWVPLDKFSWTYGMTLNWVPQTKQFSLAASYPSSAGQAGTPTPTTTTDPPQWTVVQASE